MTQVPLGWSQMVPFTLKNWHLSHFEDDWYYENYLCSYLYSMLHTYLINVSQKAHPLLSRVKYCIRRQWCKCNMITPARTWTWLFQTLVGCSYHWATCTWALALEQIETDTIQFLQVLSFIAYIDPAQSFSMTHVKSHKKSSIKKV